MNGLTALLSGLLAEPAGGALRFEPVAVGVGFGVVLSDFPAALVVELAALFLTEAAAARSFSSCLSFSSWKYRNR